MRKEIICDILKQRRKQLGFTQQEIADKANFTRRQYYTDIENNATNFGIDSLLSLLSILGMELHLKPTDGSKEASTPAPISYETYGKIKMNMLYPEVKKLLSGNGKELSSCSSKLNGKTVIQQTILWSNSNQTKSISVSFSNGKAISKSQSNL